MLVIACYGGCHLQRELGDRRTGVCRVRGLDVRHARLTSRLAEVEGDDDAVFVIDFCTGPVRRARWLCAHEVASLATAASTVCAALLIHSKASQGVLKSMATYIGRLGSYVL